MKSVLSILACLLITQISIAQSPALVKDIETAITDLGKPTGLIVYNGHVYFSKYSLEHGEELWRSDGTTTELFADIYTGTQSSSPSDFEIFNNELYFRARSVNSQGSLYDLWKTDGTTTTLVKLSIHPEQITATTSSLFFVGLEASTAKELWKSDGTTEGTVLVKNIAPSNSPSEIRGLTAVGDDVFFGATLNPSTIPTPYELWFSDGTEAGTIMLDASPSSNASNPLNLLEFSGKLYFTALAADGLNKSLYTSDGTVAGTTAVTSLVGFGQSDPTLYKTPSNVYYWDSNFGSKRLYSYDGNTTTLLKTFDNSVFSVDFRSNFEDILYLTGPTTGGASATYYSVNAGVVATSLVKPVEQGVAMNGLYYYINGSKLFSTDGDDASITEIDDLSNGLMVNPKNLTLLGSDIFFLAGDNTEHTQLWKTDGSVQASVRLTEKGFVSNTGSSPTTLTVLNNKLYFNTSSGAVYETDGTEANTTLAIAASSIKEGGVVMNGEYYYSLGNNFLDKLMKTDGTTITELFGTDKRITNLTVAGNKIFFASTTNSDETELWVTDGTVGNKTMLDLASGGTFSSLPTQLADVDGVLYFTAIDLGSGTRGLWRTDGTLVGSEVIDSDVAYSITEFRRVGDYLYYVTDELLTGIELKSYNLLTSEFHTFDMNPGTADANPQKLTVFNDKLYFFAAVTYPRALCSVSENADPEIILPVTTQFISEIGVGHNFISFYQNHFSEITHYTVHTDGMVTNPANSYLMSFYSTYAGTRWVLNNLTYFISNGGLVETDGTDAGTKLVQSSIVLKQNQSNVAEATLFNDEMFFVYDDGLIGKELYKYKSDLQDFALTAPSDLVFEQTSTNELLISWTNGSGDGRIVVMSANTPAALPKNISYTPNTIFGESVLAEGFATSVVFVASGSSVTVAGLTPGTTYHMAVVEYTEDTPGDFKYDRQHLLRGSFQMEKSDQTITADDVLKTFGDAPFALEASASSGLPVVYTYMSGPGQLLNSSLTITGAGEIVIKVTQPGDTQYNAAPDEEMVITVAKADWPIVFPAVDPALVYSPVIDIDLTFYSNVVYEITQGVATIGGGISSGFFDVRNVNAGTITVRATRAGDNNHNETIDELTFDIAKADQQISYTAQDDTDYLAQTATLDAVSDSGLPVTITIVSGAVTLTGNDLAFTGVGTVEIELSQPGNVNYHAAETIEDSFVISPSDQIITFDIPQEIPYSTVAFPITVTTNSGQTAVVSIVSGKGTIIGANPLYQFSSAGDATGEVTLEAVVGTGGGLYNPAFEQFSFTVVKGANVISFEPNNITYTTGSVELTASASSALAVSFTQTGGSGEVTFVNDEMTIVSAGTIEVMASQSGNENWSEASPVTKTFTILKADQSIAFNPGNITYTPDPVTLIGTADSGLPLVYEKTGGTGIVTLNEAVMTIQVAGTVELTVSQSGNTNWNAAASVIRNFTIAKATQTIDFQELESITKTVTSIPLSASSSSGLTVSFVSQSGRTVISGNNATVQPVSSGSETIVASQSGNENYEAAAQVSRTFCISPITPTVSASGLETGNAQLQVNNIVDAIDWYRNGTFLESKSANSVLSISDEGVYKALAKANDDCPSSAFSNELTLVITDIEKDATGTKVNLFPNPVHTELHIELSAFGSEHDVQIVVTDMLGRVMDARTGKGKQTVSINVQTYPAGQYLVHLKHATNAQVDQFIKSNN